MVLYGSSHPQADMPIVMMMMEDELATCTLTATIDADPDAGAVLLLLSLSVVSDESWLGVDAGEQSLVLRAQFSASPFEYEVSSIGGDAIERFDDFAKVPCESRTFLYERKGASFVDLPLTVVATLADASTAAIASEFTTLYVRVMPNYSLGKKALQEKLTCQDR